MEPRKQAIISALRAFVAQRSGIEFGNYGDVKAFRAEQRSITKDLHDVRELMRAVELSSITADDLIRAGVGAFSGRLSIEFTEFEGQDPCGNPKALLHVCRWCNQPASAHIPGSAPQDPHACPILVVRIEYVTGQYFPTEYRKAVCAVLASALWEYTREHCMPKPDKIKVNGDGEERDVYPGCLSAGDWLRSHFRATFGRGIASRWFL